MTGNTVISLRDHAAVAEAKGAGTFVRIDRRTRWGNPFAIGKNKDGTREEVIQKYRTWITDQADLLGDLDELRGKTLACWCKPEPCHGDVLVALLTEASQ